MLERYTPSLLEIRTYIDTNPFMLFAYLDVFDEWGEVECDYMLSHCEAKDLDELMSFVFEGKWLPLPEWPVTPWKSTFTWCLHDKPEAGEGFGHGRRCQFRNEDGKYPKNRIYFNVGSNMHPHWVVPIPIQVTGTSNILTLTTNGVTTT